MTRSQAFPSQYLSKDDVTPPVTATVDTVSIQQIKSEHGVEEKPVLYFRGTTKPLILNGTNWNSIAEAYGDESDRWPGKRVELYLDPNVMFGKDRVGGVRIRIPAAVPANPVDLDEHDVWTLERLVQEATALGVDKTLLGQHLRELGLTKYSAPRDTGLARGLIESIKQRRAAAGLSGPTPDESQINEQDIPF